MNDQERTPEQYILMIERDPHYELTSKRKRNIPNVQLDFSGWFAQTVVLHKENYKKS